MSKTEHTTLILLLGGSGARFESPIPKQFIRLSGHEHPLFMQSLIALTKYVIIDHLILVVNKAFVQHKEFLTPLNAYKKSKPELKIDIVHGGTNRHESFLKGAANLISGENHAILVHDANRPYISPNFGETISNQIRTLSDVRSCLIPVLPSVDSLCRVSDNGKVVDYLQRENTFRIQTPQLLFAPCVEKALQKAKIYNMPAEYTDEGSFMRSMGFAVFTFPGDAENKKITNQIDLL